MAWRVIPLLAAVTLIAGLTPVGARLATSELPPMSIAFVRFGAAGVLMAVTVRALRLPWSFSRRDLPMLVGLAVLCVPVNQAGFLFGIQWSNASHAGIAYALVPVFVLWISVALRRASPTVRIILATTLAFLGACVIVLSTRGGATRGSESASFLAGDLCLLSAAVSWALFSVLSQPLVRRHGAMQTLMSVFLIGAVIHGPFVVIDYCCLELGRLDWDSITWHGVAGLAFLTLVTAYTNYLLWYLVIARFDVTKSAIVVNLSFLITVMTEALFLDLTLSWWVAVGSVPLVAGIALATYVPNRIRATPGVPVPGRSQTDGGARAG